MRIFIATILVAIIICSCGTKPDSSDSVRKKHFPVFLSKLKTLDPGFTYDMEKQDTEDCYIPEGDADSLFYTSSLPILGQMSNGKIHSVIHFEPADDVYPVIRTYLNDGTPIDSASLVYGNCAGWDCDFDTCEEKFAIVSLTTIEDIITLVTTPCDSLGVKNPKLTKTEVWKKTTTIDEKGKLITTEMKS